MFLLVPGADYVVLDLNDERAERLKVLDAVDLVGSEGALLSVRLSGSVGIDDLSPVSHGSDRGSGGLLDADGRRIGLGLVLCFRFEIDIDPASAPGELDVSGGSVLRA